LPTVDSLHGFDIAAARFDHLQVGRIMSLMILTGFLAMAAGAAISAVWSLRGRLRELSTTGVDLVRLLRSIIVGGLVVLPLYVGALFGTGSLNSGVASNRVFGDWYVRTEVLPFTWGTRNIYARAGQTIVLEYAMTRELGELDVRVWPSKPIIGSLGPFDSHPVWSGSLERSGTGTIKVQAAKDGYY